MIRILALVLASILVLYTLIKNNEVEITNTETQKVKQIVKKRFSTKQKMITSFLSSDLLIKNESPEKYQNAYNYYAVNRKEIQELLISEINTINQNIINNENIPIIKKENIVFLPMIYIKSIDLIDFGQKLNKSKFEYNEVFNKKEPLEIKNDIFIGYSFFEIGKNKTLVVFSAPKDPDPLFNKNSRIVDLITFFKISEKSQEYNIERDFFVLTGI